MDTFKAFVCGAIFLFSFIWTRNFIGDIVYLGVLPSLAYAVSASVSSMGILGSIVWGMKLANEQKPRINQRLSERYLARTRRINRG